MPTRKPALPAPALSTRERVLGAAERLLATGRPEFSMRDLATEAGVSFATPFNQFGSKVAIMHALSAERIEAMHARLAASAPPEPGPARVLAAMEIAASVMLERPEVNRVVMGALGAPAAAPGHVFARSRALWAEAMGDAATFADPAGANALLPDQLAFAFRGVLSFWTAGEIADADLVASARRAAAMAMLGFAPPEMRRVLLATCSR
ncbi:TetR/AcrR family transcriptional regulator [Sphingomonas sp. AP4-R1]|uniref:TetR/AcrR family transcriptional regulator n=1 Tax=Sphingomonas sp. AP4-R1 TaxID=2735134 RepID=UPI00149339E2|nr:TetR/AcrR family transcriptional regulator [Sphingomonas sp. AP4-R1]QJU57806.1 TetR/AcrR family transcriptional regulator [Sphingomonas sp. AP4-R1]